MSDSTSTPPPKQAASQARISAMTGADSRVDAAHASWSAENSSEKEILRHEENPPATATAEQVRVQAGQLAAHLRIKQEELDRRESQLHSQCAAAEDAARASKMWSDEQQNKIHEQQNQLEELARELELRAATLSAAELSVDGASLQLKQQLADQQHRLEANSRELQERSRRLKKQEEQLRRAGDQLTKTRDRDKKEIALLQQKYDAKHLEQENNARALIRNIEHRREILAQQEIQLDKLKQQPSEKQAQTEIHLRERCKELDARSQYLDDAEFLFDQQWADLNRQRQLIEEEKEKGEALVQSQRHSIAGEQNAREASLRKQRKDFDHRNSLLEQRHDAIQQMHQEVMQRHRESLEMRLAIEELWADLAGRNAPAALAQSLAQIRTKISDHFSIQSDYLDGQREEIQKQIELLQAKTTDLREQQQTVQQWTERQNKEVELQAARLVAREQELDCQTKKIGRREAEWEDQRRELQNEIRDILRTLRRPEQAAA